MNEQQERELWREYADKKDEFEDLGVRLNADRIADYWITRMRENLELMNNGVPFTCNQSDLSISNKISK